MTSPALLLGDVATEVVSPAVARVVSQADLAGEVGIGVASPAVAGAASLADLAGDVVVGKASPAVAGVASLADLAEVVTVGVTPSAVAGVASLADAGVVSLADAGVVALVDLAGGVTVGVASLADAGVVSLADAGVASMADAGVASLADAGVASLADLAGSVAGGVTNLAVPVRVRTEEVTLLQECVVRDPSVFDGSVYCRYIATWIVMIVHRPMLRVVRLARFVTIWVVNMLTMWAATRTVWTKLYRRAVMITWLGRCHMNRFVLLRMI